MEWRESRLEERAAEPRKISNQQRDALLAALRDARKGPIRVNFLGNDSEAADYAGQFKEVFEAAGFTIAGHEGFVSFGRPRELTLKIAYVDSVPAYALEIEKAFNAAGFEIEKVLSPQRSIDAQSVSVGIGEKSTPQTGTLPLWKSLEKVCRLKKLLGWAVLLLIPFLIFTTEQRQKVLEARQQVTDENQRSNEKAASDKERAELKAEIARHEEQYGPRRIPNERRQKILTETVAGPKGRVGLFVISLDEEAAAYSKQLTEALTAAGFVVERVGAWGAGSPAGLWLGLNNTTNAPNHSATLFHGLRNAGVQIELRPDPKLSQDAVSLYVGSKPVGAPRK